MPDTPGPDALDSFLGQLVILDTQGPLLYIGTLERAEKTFLSLCAADVHDIRDSRTSKDLYLVETRNLGVRENRARVVIMREQVASISLLKDVVD